MNKAVLFIQGGGGEADHAADAKLVSSLRDILGETYTVYYPLLHDDSTPDFGRIDQINKALSSLQGEVILIGHSLGASMLLKYLSENEVKKNVVGVFLISTPFWTGDEEWKEGLKLKESFADKLSNDPPIFFYHCRDDEEVPFAHLALYRKELPWATFREISEGGHQLNNDASIVAKDIKTL